MGLDCTAYEFIEFAKSDFEDSDYDTYVRVHDYGGFDRRDGLKLGAYLASGETFSWRAGSYSGYNWIRDKLSVAALGVPATTVWANREKFEGKPMYELIDFSDCEGILGPQTCRKLADDLNSDFDGIVSRFDAQCEDCYSYVDLIKEWQKALNLAADTGIIDFH